MKKREDKRPIIAMCYDFDKTLSPKDMQEYTLIPTLGKDTSEFWETSEKFAQEHEMDKILSYMKLIVKCANERRDELALTEKAFKKMGKEVELFDGVIEWFDRINKYADDQGLIIEHYIISAGLKEIIEGTVIANKFKAIYASSFVYTANGEPIWPKQVVNYTQKTQYLFRINKNCLDLSDEQSINATIPDDERRIPFHNFIYIGDSDTDIPAMKVVKKSNGCAIGVYNPKSSGADKACHLLGEERIDFFAPADYRDGSELDCYVKKVIDSIKANEEIIAVKNLQNGMLGFLDKVFDILNYLRDVVSECENKDELYDAKKEILRFVKGAKKKLESNYVGTYVNSGDILNIIDAKSKEINNLIKEKGKEFKTK